MQGTNHKIKIGNKCFEWVEWFRYLGTTLTNRNTINEELRSISKTGNACYRSMQDLGPSCLLSKNIKLVVLYGCKTWSLTLREEHRLKVFEIGAEEGI